MAWQKKALLHYSRRRDIKLIIVNGTTTNLPQTLLHREASGELHVSHVVTCPCNNGTILIVLTISKAGQSYDKVHPYP